MSRDYSLNFDDCQMIKLTAHVDRCFALQVLNNAQFYVGLKMWEILCNYTISN